MLCFCARHRHRRSDHLTRVELERTTDLFITDTTMDQDDLQGYETCLTDPQGKQFLGTTAKFDENWGIIPLRPGLQLGGYVPFLRRR